MKIDVIVAINKYIGILLLFAKFKHSSVVRVYALIWSYFDKTNKTSIRPTIVEEFLLNVDQLATMHLIIAFNTRIRDTIPSR